MSHFSVVVFTHDGDYDRLLAPYCEQDETYFRPDIAYANDAELEAGYQEWLEKRKTDTFSQKYSYRDAKEWATGWHGFCQFDSGAWGYMNNPDAKWDWYQEEGRFGSLRLKHPIPDDEEIRVRDLDTSIDQKRYDKAIAYWESYVERGEEPDRFEFCKPEYYTETYGTKERYATMMATDIPYAFVTPDGEWCERGRMGWFGCSDATAEKVDALLNAYLAFVNNPKNANLFVHHIDCHI